VDDILPRCGLTEVADRRIGHLSKGYKQRVGLAQAIVHNPPVLILDEPTIGLDPAQIVEIRGLIRGLAGGHTVILSTHILPEVTQICDRVVVIRRGKVVADDTFAALAKRMGETGRLFVRVDGATDAVGKLRALPEVQGVEDAADGGLVVRAAQGADITGRVADLAAREGWRVRELRRDLVTLEEVYIRLTSQ
jgi:ABC-2 type transport system ATP-binding protein